MSYVLFIFILQAVEHVGLAAQGEGGKFWEEAYKRNPGKEKPLNINTHGGLMHFGAPGSGTSLCMFIYIYILSFIHPIIHLKLYLLLP